MNGIGGSTIKEAKRNLSLDEFLVWREYIAKRGCLNVARRIEQEVGQLRFVTARVNGDKQSELRDFLPHEYSSSPDNEEPASFDEIINVFQNAAS